MLKYLFLYKSTHWRNLRFGVPMTTTALSTFSAQFCRNSVQLNYTQRFPARTDPVKTDTRKDVFFEWA
jgi:hypothetical protein